MGTDTGISVAVYSRDGVYLYGDGVADILTGELVSSDTAFYVASSTKSFTSLALQIFEYQGKLSLQSSLSAFSPGIRIPIIVDADKVKLQDLLTHTSGIDNEGIGFRSAYSGVHSFEKLKALISASEPNLEAPLGTFSYTNVGYNILSILLESELDETWQDLITVNIINRLGMDRTSARFSYAVDEGWSIAYPHLPSPDGAMRSARLRKTDETMHAAGGLIMSARDALKWLELFVENGSVGGETYFPPEMIVNSRRTVAQVDTKFGPYDRDGYGLGWYIGRYNDELLVHHFGSFPGYRAHISYMPDRQIGVAVFVNEALAGSLIADQIANWVYDRHDGKEIPAGQIEQLSAQYKRILGSLAGREASLTSRPWRLALEKESYIGNFVHSQLGQLSLTENDDELWAEIGMLSAPLQPYDAEETARVELIPMSGSLLKFDIVDGEVIGAYWNDVRFEKQ